MCTVWPQFFFFALHTNVTQKKFNIQIKYCHGLALTQFQRASPKTQNKVDAINYGLILRIKGFNPFQTVQVFSICLQLTIQCDWLCSYTSSTLVAGGTSLKKGISLLLISFIISWSPENCSNFRMQKVLHRSMCQIKNLHRKCRFRLLAVEMIEMICNHSINELFEIESTERNSKYRFSLGIRY